MNGCKQNSIALAEIQRERARRSPHYFIHTFIWIDCEPDWQPFHLWPAQQDTLNLFQAQQRIIVLKARQLGLSWLVLSFALWQMLFRPGTTGLFFSKGEREAGELLRRFRGMVEHLPDWLRPQLIKPNNTEKLTFANGSNAEVFPTTGGRSYTGSLVVVDEGDWFEGAANLDKLLNAVKPTVDAGGRLILLSTPDKGKPESLFKSIYRAAREARNSYHPVFLPWDARPTRTPTWYEQEKIDCLANTGSLDNLHQEYPASEIEALAPRSLDKRIPPQWLQQCYAPAGPAHVPGPYLPRPPALPGLVLYVLPAVNRRYVLGADPAEGNPTSDESAATVLDADSGEEVAFLAGRFQPDTFADYIEQLCVFYHKASALIERNNHGHAVISALSRERKAKLLAGHDTKVGWLSSGKGKALLYSICAEAFRDQETIIHSFTTLQQLQSIEGSTLLAPAGQHDDRADSYALALVAAEKVVGRVGPGKAAPTTYKLRT